MNRLLSLAMTFALLLALLAGTAVPLCAQHPDPAPATRSHEALASVQAALHAAENARLEVLRSMRPGAVRAALLADLEAAIDRLGRARVRLDPTHRGRVRQAPKEGRAIEIEEEEEVAEVEEVDEEEMEGVEERPARPLPAGEVPDSMRLRASTALGLEWLLLHQDEDGKWDADAFMKHDKRGKPCDGPGNPVHDVGVTALAVLALLRHERTPANDRCRGAVTKAVGWLRNQQDEASGLIGMNASHDFIYDHAIATLALLEALPVLGDATVDKSAQRAINYLESHRNPYAVWRYQPRDNDNDTSVTAWCATAYDTARTQALAVNPAAFKTIEAYLGEVTDASTGRAGYTRLGEPSSRHPGDHSVRFPPRLSRGLTAAALDVRLRLGQDPGKRKVLQLAAEDLLTRLPTASDPRSRDHYFWFFGTEALHRFGGAPWQTWWRPMARVTVATQRRDGPATGSWDPSGVWGEDGGRVYSTALMLLTMHRLEKAAAATEKR